MITQNNTIKTEFSDFVGVQKKISSTLKIISIILLVTGSLGLVAYIAVSTALETIYESAPVWCEALLVSAVPFAFGLIFLLTINARIKQSGKNAGTVNSYEFFSDCLVIRSSRAGMQLGVFRADYSKIIKTAEKGGYLLFYYAASAAVFPLDKTKLTAEELNTVKKLLRARLPEGAQTLNLSSFAETTQELSVNN